MNKSRTEQSENIQLRNKLLECVSSSWIAQAIYVASELRIADLLTDRPMTSKKLAAITGAHAPSLHRLLQALATIEICRERRDGAFEITPMGSLLRIDMPGSLRSWTIYWGSQLWQVWGNLLYSIKTGKSARKLLTGTDDFGHLKQNSKAAAIFNQAAAELTNLASKSILQAYDFSPFKRIMDVGGGYGELLIHILKANPTALGILFDLRHSVVGAKRHFKKADLTSRCKFLEGNFFKSIPSGADVYILKSILHDWDDKNCKLILKNCRRAMTKGIRLLIVERIIPNQLATSVFHQALARQDLTMLITHATKERTEAEFRGLLNSAGLRVTKILPCGMFNIIESFPQ